MELKPGYKMTEVGVIPEDWECLYIGDFTDCTAGGTPNTQIADYWGGQHPWMNSGDLHKKYVSSVDGRITDKGLNNSSTKYIPESSCLIGLAGQGKTRGTAALAKIELCINQSIAAVFPSNKHNSAYLFHNLDSRYDELRLLSSGDGGRGGLNLTLIRKLAVALPPIPEQTAIAEALSDVDALLSSLDALIAKKRDMKQAAMQELLTGRRRLGGFEGEWHSISIGDSKYSDIDREYLASNTDPNYLFFYITLENVDNGKLLNTIYCKYETSPSRARKIPHHNDILFGMVRPNLHSHLFIDKNIKDTVCSTGFCVISCKQEYLIPLFLYYKLFSTEIDIQINQIITGSNYPAISSADVKKLKTTIPPTIAEQTAIAAVLSDMDAEIAALEARRAKTQALKQGMMQELLTGRTRLRPAEGESHA